MLVVIEGANGIGKTTISKHLYDYLDKQGFFVTLFKQPTESKLGKFIKHMENELSGLPYLFLLLSDRYNLINQLQKKINDKNHIVILDRYVLSSIALQNLDGIPIDLIWELNKYLPIPDLTILLTGDENTLENRLNERKNKTRLEINYSSKEEIEHFFKGKTFLEKQGYIIEIVNNTNIELMENISKINQLILDMLDK